VRTASARNSLLVFLACVIEHPAFRHQVRRGGRWFAATRFRGGTDLIDAALRLDLATRSAMLAGSILE
jgi:hypothetical protein